MEPQCAPYLRSGLSPFPKDRLDDLLYSIPTTGTHSLDMTTPDNSDDSPKKLPRLEPQKVEYIVTVNRDAMSLLDRSYD